MTQIQPSYGEPLPVWLVVPPPAPQRRWTVLIRAILVIPHAFCLAFVGLAAAVLTVIGWFAAVFTGRLPGFVREFVIGFLEWQGRVGGYAFLLTDRHPPYTMGPADHPVQVLVPPAQRLNRAAVLFRIILLIPANIVASAVIYGASTLLLLLHWLITLVKGEPSAAFAGAYASALRLQLRYTAYAYMLTPAYPWHGLFGDPPVGSGAGWPGAPVPVMGWPAASAPGWPAAPVGSAWPGPAPVGSEPGGPVPDVFTFGGAAHLWGYTADRRVCGIWRREQPGFPAEWWPIERQDEAWRRFRQLEPSAVEYHGPTPAELGFGASVPAPGPAVASPAAAFGSPGMPGYGMVGALPAAPAFAAEVPATSGPAPSLVLESGSRVLLVLFIVVGVVSWAALRAFTQGPGLQNVLNGPAQQQLQQDYTTLRSATDRFESQVNQCTTTGDLSCVTAADRAEGAAFGTFRSELGSITVLGTAANADLDQLRSITTEVTSLFRQLGAVTTPQQYQQLAANSPLPTLLNRFDTTYNQLQVDLGGSS